MKNEDSFRLPIKLYCYFGVLKFFKTIKCCSVVTLIKFSDAIDLTQIYYFQLFQTGARLIVKNCIADQSLCVMNQNWIQTFFGAVSFNIMSVLEYLR